MRMGLGFDVHEFSDNRPLVLAGVRIPHSRGLLGHSDADVVLHAIMDALLGSLALGDIGQHFPNTDERYRDADSADLTRRVTQLVEDAGYEINNIDVMVLAEEPKLAPHKEVMRHRLSELLGCGVAKISIKATTLEGMGFVGRREGMACMAIATVAPVATHSKA